MRQRRFRYDWSRTWDDRPYDFIAKDGDLRIGRVFRIEGGPGDGRWKWAMTASIGNRMGSSSDVADTRDEACHAVERAYRQFAGWLFLFCGMLWML